MDQVAGKDLSRWAMLSIAVAVVTIALKTTAWLLTGSVGLLSDAAESVVNLVAAVVAFIALRIAARPADDEHQFGHAKSEYFSAVIEGVMIVVAAGVIIYTAVERLLHPRELESIGLGLLIAVVASVLNGVVALLLIRVGRSHRSITLEADGKHLLTDVWTTVGVVVGVGLVAWTGWLPLDSIVAIAVAINILVVGYLLIRRSAAGLMDAALTPEDQAEIDQTLDRFRTGEIDFHDVRSRESGRLRFVQMHMLVPGDWSVQQGHDRVEQVEAALRSELPGLIVTVHLEPIEDPRAYEPWRR
ncbi:putative cation efflux protein [Gordonia hirsuta DSM 44140 = NBRC 16056]|uniref:Putative cation efflux protein n=1 Tax=Gordonia hirsuta DSM 44140 = NBRC 16056 TaxID=1121927 RepID=L7LFS4_9ACTN|nr:cation diffusion facilitator family transporter [Gordonia hirsuta]GAC58918.1 putative cation efflux protein [Gordonia hirsuta DSM 44140 = NBRC 16056]